MMEDYVTGYFVIMAIIGVFVFRNAGKRSPADTAGGDALFAGLLFGIVFPILLIWAPYDWYIQRRDKKVDRKVE